MIGPTAARCMLLSFSGPHLLLPKVETFSPVSIQAFHKLFQAVFHKTALFAFNQSCAQSLYPRFMFFQKAQAGTNNFAGASIAAIFELFCYKCLKMVSDRYASISRHGFHSVLHIGISCLAPLNKSRQQGRFAPGPLNSGPCLKRYAA